jgi:enoyl-CoA hydratase/carnithine racemase
MRGTAAIEGSFPRMYASFGLQRATLLALSAYTLKAEEAVQWGLVQKIVESEELVSEAVRMASLIAGMSPDSVVVSRSGIRQAMETASVERATQLTAEMFAERLMNGENVQEGMRAFQEKREPKWVPSKL